MTHDQVNKIGDLRQALEMVQPYALGLIPCGRTKRQLPHVFDSALESSGAMLLEERAEADRITAALALLDSPQPGMVVTLSTGETYEIMENGWVRATWAPGKGDLTWARLPTIIPLLRAAIRDGATLTMPGEKE